ncbi:disulfide bond formation protein B, partial [Salmonella enterica subsp. enterica serovar Kentucky]|nr:disulfide bond formation protein B [Salmonella enterica subsp. enterica serovar Kentucky]
RGAWLLMAFTALALEMVALWFQHVMLLKPCVLCIYERCALFGMWIVDLNKSDLERLGTSWSGSITIGDKLGVSLNQSSISTLDG